MNNARRLILKTTIPWFLMLAAWPASSQSPYPGGSLADKPNPFFESETQQVGGMGIYKWYTFVGALRCGANEAIVGLYSRRGSVLDYVRIACAPITCGPKGCGWQRARWGPGAGNANGGSKTSQEICPVDSIVAGFRGGSASNNEYATDIQVECARLTGRALGQTATGMGAQKFGVLGKANVGQGYGRGGFGRTSELRYAREPRSWPQHIAFSSSDNQRLSSCVSGGATALSVGVARWNVVHEVVQAFTMFCASGFSTDVLEDSINQR